MILNARKLNDTGYYINKAFSKETVEIRKVNWKNVKELRKNGKYAILVYGKVFWREKRSSENTPYICSDVSKYIYIYIFVKNFLLR